MNKFGYFRNVEFDSDPSAGTVSKKCAKGKIINPRTGRCVNINSPVLRKQKIVTVVPKSSPRPSPRPSPKSVKDVIVTTIKPEILWSGGDALFKNRRNLARIRLWWLDRLKVPHGGTFPLKNIIIQPDSKNGYLEVSYDYPPSFAPDAIEFDTANEYITDPDANGNNPIYIKNGDSFNK